MLLEKNIEEVPAYLTSLQSGESESNSAAASLIDNVWYRPGTYFKLAKRFSEIGSVFFGLYNQCFLDDLIISVGRTVNSFSGGFNTVTTIGVYFLNLLNFDDPDNDIVVMYNTYLAASPSDAQIKDFGLRLGKGFTKIFNVQVPSVQYQDF